MIIVAVPTIPERRHLREPVEEAWRHHTCQPIDVMFSEAGTSWCDGLNAIFDQIRDDPPLVFVCGSDDMIPSDDNWLPPLLTLMGRGVYPAPLVDDPRFTNYGGHPQPVADGTPSDMSSFPVLHREWLAAVFPLPAGLMYYGDNLISVLLARAGIPCVACPSSRIRHLHAPEGRGAGYGTEERRMLVDTVRYSRALQALGIDRGCLPAGQRGPLWEEAWIGKGLAIDPDPVISDG